MAITLAQARDLDRHEKIYLVEITLQNSGGTKYISNKKVTFSAQLYEPYVDVINSINETLERDTSRNITGNIILRILNEAYLTYDYFFEIGETYPFELSTISIYEAAYVDGEITSDRDLILSGYCDQVPRIDERTFDLRVVKRELINKIVRRAV